MQMLQLSGISKAALIKDTISTPNRIKKEGLISFLLVVIVLQVPGHCTIYI